MLPPLSPITLTGRRVELQPLSSAHAADLQSAAGDLYKLWVTSVPKAENMPAFIREALALQDAGAALPFAIVEKQSGRAVGTTRFAHIRREHHSVEIGWTWIGLPWQRTFVNTEAKYQLLQYAFERLGCLRVEFKTDVLNERSQRAIERIGAKREGVFRKHMIMGDGRVRDSVYYAMTHDDWPNAKAELERKMDRE